jgi:hypothetical protein
MINGVWLIRSRMVLRGVWLIMADNDKFKVRGSRLMNQFYKPFIHLIALMPKLNLGTIEGCQSAALKNI